MPSMVIIVFVLVLVLTIGFALVLSRSMHRRDVDQIKDRLSGKARTPKAPCRRN